MGRRDWRNVYFKPSEVVLHNKPDDCWVSLMGVVKDLTPLFQQYRNRPELLKPILAEAGKDISHWFNKKGDIQTYVHPVTGAIMPYLPHGKIPHLEQSELPDPKWRPPPPIPWWQDEKFNVGNLTRNVRAIRILNILTQKEIVLYVCEEETIEQILERYLPYNSNAKSYTWKFQKKKLDMKKTLAENGIIDEKDKFKRLGLPEDLYIPCLMLYYDDIYE